MLLGAESDQLARRGEQRRLSQAAQVAAWGHRALDVGGMSRVCSPGNYSSTRSWAMSWTVVPTETAGDNTLLSRQVLAGLAPPPGSSLTRVTPTTPLDPQAGAPVVVSKGT